MVLPEYKFYVGTGLSLNLVPDRSIDVDTGDYWTGNTNVVSSDKLHITTKLLYIDYTVSSDMFGTTGIHDEALYLFTYDSDLTYLGRKRIETAQVCALNDNVAFIAIEFIGQSEAMQLAHRNLAKSKFTDLYTMQLSHPYYKSISKKYSKENNQEFFRAILDGKISLYGEDYDYVAGSRLDDKLAFFIEKLNTVSNIWEIYYKGIFSKTDCKLDRDKKKCELKLIAMDQYTKVLNGYDHTYDLIKLAPVIEQIYMYKRPMIQVYIRGSHTITNFQGGTYWEADVNVATDNDEELRNKYFFKYIKTGIEFYVDGLAEDGANGIYAGVDGVWVNNKGYTAYLYNQGSISPGYYSYNLYIKRDSDNTNIYTSFVYTSKDGSGNHLPDLPLFIHRVDANQEDWPNDSTNIVTQFTYDIYQRLLCNVDTIQDAEGTKATYDLPYDDLAVDNRNYKKCIGLQGGQFFCTSLETTEPTKYGLNDNNKYFTNKGLRGYNTYRLLPVGHNFWVNASIWYAYSENSYTKIETSARETFTLKNSYSIASIIKVLLAKLDPTLMHEATAEYSEFLYGASLPIFPIDDTRFYVYLTPKSNILKGNYDQPAQKAELTFEDLMKMLRDCFRCYWYIDGNKFKIEHISYFMNGGSYNGVQHITPSLPFIPSLDSTQLELQFMRDQFNKKRISYYQGAVEYDKSNLNSRYEFEWMDDATELFRGPYVDVLSNYVQKDKTENINVNQFSSDVDYMLLNPSSFSEDGFALLCPMHIRGALRLPVVDDLMVDDEGQQYGFISQNFFASWKYLLRYYMYDMPAAKIDISEGIMYTVSDIKKCMKHAIEFPLAEDLDTLKSIMTPVGFGKIDDYSVDLTTRIIKATLAYKPN